MDISALNGSSVCKTVSERRRSRVVRAACLWCRNSARGWALSFDDWKTLSVNPAVNGYLFQNRQDEAEEKGGRVSPLICCAQDTEDTVWLYPPPPAPHNAPTSIWL